MNSLQQKCVLLVDQPPEDLRGLARLLNHLQCPFAVAETRNLRWSHDHIPHLIILGSGQHWSHTQVQQLREWMANTAGKHGAVIVALADNSHSSWPTQEENPGFDGVLVKPLSVDVLASLIESAWVRHLHPVASAS